MLLWVAVAAAPLLIHLLNRRQYREIQWAAMRYLLAAVKKQSRRVRVENLILLLIRTALVILFVAALAQMYWQQQATQSVERENVHRLIVLDGSYSMGYRPGNKTRFELAKQKALQIIQETSQVGDSLSLVLMSSPAKVLVGTATLNHQQVAQIVRETELPHTSGDLVQTLGELKNIIQNTKDTTYSKKREIYLISDLGRTSWAPNSEVQAQIARQLEALAEQATIHLVNLGQSAVQNTAIVDARTDDTFAIVGRPVLFQAILQHFGSKVPSKPLQLELYVDDRRVQDRSVSLTESGHALAHFDYRFDTPGNYKVEIRLAKPDSDLAIDNHRWMSLEVKESIRILCIGGQPGANRYLKVAFAAPRYTKPLVQADFVTHSSLSEINLQQYDCLFLNNIGQFDRLEVTELEKFSARGKGIVFFLGDQVQPENYNRLLKANKSAEPGIFPVRLLGASDYRKAAYLFDPKEYQHPLIKTWAKHPQAGLFAPQVFKYMRMQISQPRVASVAMGFASNQYPAIVEADIVHQRTVGQDRTSRVIVFSFPVSTTSQDQNYRAAWTNFPTLPSFVPMIQETWRRAIQPQRLRRNLKVGDLLTASMNAAEASNPKVKVKLPNERILPAAVVGELNQLSWTFDATMQSGIYSITSSQQKQSEPTYFALNVQTIESDLTRVDLTELPSVLRVSHESESSETQQAEQEMSQTKRSHWLLYIVLGLLVSETLLAWYFGKRAS